MIKIVGLREDIQMGLALRQQINRWLLSAYQKDRHNQPAPISKNHSQ